jgi:MFS family permease
VPENSYIGLFLQVGAAGLAAFAVFLGVVLAQGTLALSRLADRERRLGAACAGAIVGGLVLAIFQSYLYSVGNNATAAFWICVFLLGGLAPLRSRVAERA